MKNILEESKLMNILVTGSAGFVALHLIEELLKDESNSITGVDNFYSGTI